MTDFERKSGDRKNLKSTGKDPMMELTRLLGRNNLSSDQHVNSNSSQVPVEDSQYDAGHADSGFNPYNTNTYTSSGYNQQAEYDYTQNNDVEYSGQENAYWSDENNGVSQNVYDAENGGVTGHYPYPDDADPTRQQSAELYEEADYSGDGGQNYAWGDAGDLSTSSSQTYQPNGSVPQEDSFYDDTTYPSQGYSVNNDINAGADSQQQAYLAHDTVDRDSQFGQNFNASNTGEANNQFANDETQYWTDGADETTLYDNDLVEGQQWSQPYDDTEQFVNEYGVEPNDAVYRNDPNQHLSYNEPIGNQAQPSNENRSGEREAYATEPQFFDNLSQDQNYLGAPNDANKDLDFSSPVEEGHGEGAFEQGRPLGAVIAPMRMATKPQSFLGYGQAVAVLPSGRGSRKLSTQGITPKDKAGFSLSRANPVEVGKSSDRGGIASGNAPIGRGVNPFTAEKVQNNTPEVASNDFEDALNDFNLTIKGDDKKRYKRDPNLKTVRPDQHSVPQTQNFDLPTVNYGEVGANDRLHNPLDQEFSDVLSSGVNDATVVPYNDPTVEGAGIQSAGIGAVPVSEFGDNTPTQLGGAAFNDSVTDASKYDWSASNGKAVKASQKSGSVKKILLLLALLAIILAGAGVYYTFFAGSEKTGQPVVIHRDEGEVRVEPEVDASASDDRSDTAVYDRVENGANMQVQQRDLVDKSETPVDLDKIEEQAPNAGETSLEPNSVESHVLQATENSLAIHEVPTVTIRDKKNVSGDDINSIIANDQDNVLAPGQTFKEHLQTHNQDQQVMPDAGLMANSSNQSSIENNSDNSNVGDNNADVGDTDIASLVGQDDGQPADNDAGLFPSEPGGVEPENRIAHGDSLDGNSENTSGSSSFSENTNRVSPEQLGASSSVSEPNSLPNDNMSVAPAENTNIGHTSAVATGNGRGWAVQAPSTLPAGTYYVQVASQPNREAAQQSLADLKRQSQVNSVIGGRQVVIVAADIPGRGTYYRVRVAAANQAAANQLCEQLKGFQVNCFVGKQL